MPQQEVTLKYSEILRRNAAFAGDLPAQRYRIALLSNVVVAHLKDLLEYELRVEEIPAVVTLGDYDNIVQDSAKSKDADLVILFWEAYNLIEGLQFKADLMDSDTVDALVVKVSTEIDFVFDNLKHTPLVLVNSFSAALFAGLSIGPRALDDLCARLNRHLGERAPRQARIVNLDQIITHLGVNASVDRRYLYSSKAPYTIAFLKAYAEAIKPYVMAARGKAKKALIFDCDNTLWKGVIGEDGMEGIEMSAATKVGAVFAEVQAIALALNRQGVVLGICSKNNPEDVDQVLRSHPDIQIRDRHLAVKRVNWQDKVSNLKEIARELNIGLDSLVMVDDSSFEVNLIREQLPQVTVLQVPESGHLYPGLLRASRGLFHTLSTTGEDRRKAEMYSEQSKRQADRVQFANLDDYLASLGTTLTIHRDNAAIVPRIAQLTQKTNQFNLTTRRYTEADIARMVADDHTAVFAFSVKDKFGESGVTGLCVVGINGKTATIDSFLMSCRVLGRRIELAFMDWLIEHLRCARIEQVKAKYLRTDKNAQVADYFDRCSFRLLEASEAQRCYALDVEAYRSTSAHNVEVIYGSADQERDGGSVQHVA
jgi:FkbH-like protein